ncbi:MAG: endonuclease/exonuclease/phosphatase family protein [Eudoraea sp.]|nr:endonuclease/exonuclease/phosphatase family protein [Eudoraea sp.]
MKRTSWFVLIWLICSGFGQAQQAFNVRTIAFYNLENLFDTVNDTTHYDDDRTANGSARWTEVRYALKLESLAKVISGIGKSVRDAPPDVLGVCEVENQYVLQDLILHQLLRSTNYAIVHIDSPDERGIDVALIYNQDHFIPISYHAQEVRLFDDTLRRDSTRDQLVVVGYLDGELMGFIVNHWPSRRGGTKKSEANRIRAARVTRKLIDSLSNEHEDIPLVIVGDFNDNPNDKSLKRVLQTRMGMDSIRRFELYNPMEKLYMKGYGTLGYRDRWSLFDQILLNKHLAVKQAKRYSFWKAGIYTPPFLVQSSGRYQGYPWSTYVKGSYAGGYSDHFPVYIHLIKKVD